MPQAPQDIGQLDQEQLVRFVIELFHRTLVHYGMWFREVGYQTDPATLIEADQKVFDLSLTIQMKRLGKILGFQVDDDGVPSRLRELPREKLLELATGQAINWLANDGIWFQQVEGSHGMDSAKRVNDTCWTQFSPYEARRIKRFLGLSERPGLEGLKQALGFRNYALVNQQSIHESDDGSLVFQMNQCRVQAARKRKGLPDYPCFSGGNVEYPYFAAAIDPRITTRCLGCPPGEHPEEWYCAWEFKLAE